VTLGGGRFEMLRKDLAGEECGCLERRVASLKQLMIDELTMHL